MARVTRGQKSSGEASLHWNLIPSLFCQSWSVLTSGAHYKSVLLIQTSALKHSLMEGVVDSVWFQ